MVCGFFIFSITGTSLNNFDLEFAKWFSENGSVDWKSLCLHYLRRKLQQQLQWKKLSNETPTFTQTATNLDKFEETMMSSDWISQDIIQNQTNNNARFFPFLEDFNPNNPNINSVGIFRIETKEVNLMVQNTSQVGNTTTQALFSSPKIVLWKQFYSTIYVLLCEETENRLAASHFLNTLPRILEDHFKKTGIAASPREFLSKLEEFLVVVHTFLPNGQLIFMNAQYSKQLRKEVDSVLLTNK